MRKKVLTGFLIFILMISLSLVIAEDDETTTDQEKVDEAYSCLREKIDDRTCSELSLEEKIFSLLAVNKCKSEIQDSKDADDCWPDNNCNIKSTAQAILALDNVGVNIDDAEAWLLLQETIPREMNWYIQIESSEETTCTIYYDGLANPITINVNEDKTVSGGGGTCLRVSSNGYWFKVSSLLDCYDKEFEISCDKDFLTSLLFQRTGSATIHVSETTTSAAAGGTTSEKVDSFCFSTLTGSCDYEGSLWAALVLDWIGEEISSYLPYLITMSEESINERYLPEAFLYFLTVDTTYRTSLLLEQKLDKYWQESGDKFYDTALALYPFQYEEPQEKIDSKEWLLEDGTQDNDGCWEGNIRNTAFLLYSIWPEGVISPDNGNGVNGILDCEQEGYDCRSRLSCRGDGGNILDTYFCSSLFVCCDTPESEETCLEIEGEICDSSEECVGGTEEITSDLGYREICCIGGGVCREKTEPVLSDCELIGGICRDLDCYDDEKESSEDCDYSGDVCCIEKTTTGKSTVWIWILLILIVLVVLGIIFKDQLRRFWFRTKSGGKRPRPRPRPGYPPAPLTGHPERMAMPRGPPQRIPARRPRGEMGEVLKKLKEMGR